MKTASTLHHDDAWLLLPWLANERLSGAQLLQVEEHLQAMRGVRARGRDSAPHGGTAHRPGARDLRARTLVAQADGAHRRPRAGAPSATRARPPALLRPRRGAFAPTWRPPGLAWAATFVLTVTLGLITATSYRWSQPLYSTYTAPRAPAAVLHIAFDRALPVGDVAEALRGAGARVVEGPGASGIFGVVPLAPLTPAHGADPVSPELRALAARLQADPRVRWIEPLAADGAQEPPAGKP